jgi:hypothetical protein
MNQSGKVFVFIVASVFLGSSSLFAQGSHPPAPPANAASPGSGSADQFTGTAPVMTFLDMYTGQPWGRYVVSESVTVPKYEYREVKERVWMPTWVQEPKSSTVTQYDPVVSYQLRPRSVPSSNPFAAPQQILEYAPIVQYQPRNVQVNQMTAYQKYEEREVTRMVPVLVNASEQRAKFVDRPLSASGTSGAASSNLIQDSAMISQANRTTARYPTRSIDYPSQPVYGAPVYGYTPANLAWAPSKTMVAPPPANGSFGPPVMFASNTTPSNPVSNVTGMPPAQYTAPANAYPPNSYPPNAYPPNVANTGPAPIVPIPPNMPASFASSGAPLPPGAYANGFPVPGGVPYGSPNPTMAGNPYLDPGTAPASYPPFNPAMYAGNPYGYAPNPAGYPPGYAPNPAGTPYGYAPNPYAYGAPQPSSFQSTYNQYMAWLSTQGSLFSTNMFSQQGGQASVATTGGFPYTGYPPGAVPQPTATTPGYTPQAPQMAGNSNGVYASSPLYWGRMPPGGSYKPPLETVGGTVGAIPPSAPPELNASVTPIPSGTVAR